MRLAITGMTLAPRTDAIYAMIDELRASPACAGVRGQAPRDPDALAQTPAAVLEFA